MEAIESDFVEESIHSSSQRHDQRGDVNGSQSSQRHRFKVVKLVLSEPYLRGRWNCKDFKDTSEQHFDGQQTPASQAQQTPPTTAVGAHTHTTTAVVTTTPATTTTGAMEASAANGVAIDNKIEQAMDLVKSHLMFAVREEVDVLKERIKELESEIQILRAHASADVLQLVVQQTSQTSSQSMNE